MKLCKFKSAPQNIGQIMPVLLDESKETLPKYASSGFIPSKRDYIVNEIITSEMSYLQQLMTVKTKIMEPMQDSKLLSEAEFNILFNNLLDVIELNRELHDLISNPENRDSIGEVFYNFLRSSSIKEIYEKYIQGYDNSVVMNIKLLKQEKYHNYIQDQLKENSHLDLPSYLIAPVQRLPRYLLLLKTLIEISDQSTEEFNYIKKALIGFEDILQTIDHNKTVSLTAAEKHAYFSKFSEKDKTLVSELKGAEPALHYPQLIPITRISDKTNGKQYDCDLILLKSHIIGLKKRTAAGSSQMHYKLLFKIEVLSSNIEFTPPSDPAPRGSRIGGSLTSSGPVYPKGLISIRETRTQSTLPFISHKSYMFTPVSSKKYNWKFYYTNFKGLYEITSNLSYLSKTANTIRGYLMKHILTSKDWNLL